MSEEKTFRIQVARAGNKKSETLILKESELKDSHIDLFHGQLMRDFNEAPKLAQDRHKMDLAAEQETTTALMIQEKQMIDTALSFEMNSIGGLREIVEKRKNAAEMFLKVGSGSTNADNLFNTNEVITIRFIFVSSSILSSLFKLILFIISFDC